MPADLPAPFSAFLGASFGLLCGFPWGWLAALDWKRRRAPAPEPAFEPSRAWLQTAETALVRAFPVGVEVREAEPPPVQTVQYRRVGTWLDNEEAAQMARLILASGQPPEGVKLTHAAMKAHGFTADARRKELLAQIIIRGKGYSRGTTGGKFTTYLKPEVAARHLERCRARGLVWDTSPAPAAGVGVHQSGDTYTDTNEHEKHGG